jgi:archaeosine-15-forming tRNA-guanine transglycosylase
MPTSCKHPQVRVVVREEDAEFVECQLCGEVFDAAEFTDILNEVNEEDPAADSHETAGDKA